MRRACFIAWVAVVGCSGQVVGTGGAGGTAGTTTGATTVGSTNSSSSSTSSASTSTGTGGTGPGGECSTAADCPPDGQCVELIPGGYRVCQFPVVSATTCSHPGLDDCCSDADCTGAGERCLPGPPVPSCGGIVPAPHNYCAKDQCTTNAQCNADEICAPAGALHNLVRSCIHAACLTPFCGLESLQPCAPIKSPCCQATQGLACAGACRTDADCPGGYCDLSTQDPTHSACKQGSPICPQ